jgi:C4-dicarboxylate transporter, DctM subunit
MSPFTLCPRLLARLLMALMALTLLVAPVYAQDGEVKSLDELMKETEAEIKADEPAEPAADDSPEKVKSLDELMAETQEELGEPAAAPSADVAPAAEEAEEAAPPQLAEPSKPWWFGPGILLIVVLGVLLGQPLYVIIGTLTLYLLYFGGIFTEFSLLASLIEQTRSLADKEVLLAIPFFVLSGAVMTEGDIAKRLIAFADALFGALPGGLAISAVFGCAFFAAISGSSPVTVIAIGSIMYPALTAAGYPERFSAGLLSSAGSLGILIPPSIPMIIYAIVDPRALRDPPGYQVTSFGAHDAGVNDLFLAGLLPGMMIAFIFAMHSFRMGLLKGIGGQQTPGEARPWGRYIGFFVGLPLIATLGPLVGAAIGSSDVSGTRTRLREATGIDFVRLWETFRDGFWALFLPVLILGGIYSGTFTPTQAAAVAVVYAVVVEFFIHRSLTLEDIPRIFTESVVLMGALFVIIALALGFNMYLDRAKIPEHAVEWILSMDLSIYTFLLIVNILLLIVGCFMDILSAILILVPLLSPIAYGLGIHPVHLAIVFIVNLEIGYLTPPIGLNLFVASSLFKKGIGEIIRAVAPFIALMMICLGLITYFPSFSLGLVALSKGQSPYVTFHDPREIKAKEAIKAAEDALKPEGDKPAAGEGKEPAGDGGAKSLEEIMGEVEGESGEGEVKSLEEIMGEVESEEADAGRAD